MTAMIPLITDSSSDLEHTCAHTVDDEIIGQLNYRQSEVLARYQRATTKFGLKSSVTESQTTMTLTASGVRTHVTYNASAS